MRVLSEGAVIVGSILAAFAIQAAWDEFRERQDEQVVLVGLRDDFRGYLTRMEAARADHEERVAAADLLLASTGVDESAVSEAELIDALSTAVLWHQVFLPAGTLGSLMESQGLALIGSSELREALVEWRQGLAELDEGNSYLVQKVSDLEDYLMPRFPGRTLTWSLGLGDSSAFPSTVAPLLREVEFENHIFYGRGASVNVLNRINDWEQAVRRILDLIEAEL